MPKTNQFAQSDKFIQKTERMINLPKSYYLKEKTERMIDLPSFYYGNEEPRLVTSNLIYFLDGAGYNIRNNEWYDSIAKNSTSKASVYDLGAGFTSPTVEDRSFKITSSTNPLVTSLSSDDFSNATGFYTISIYVKINDPAVGAKRILVIQNNPTFGSIHNAIFQLTGNPIISFRSSILAANRYTVEYGKPYMLTIVKNNDNFIYYVNDGLLTTESTSIATTRTESNTAPIVLGNITTSQPNASYYGFLVYNRVLNQREIKDNYKYLKSRYS